VRVDLGVVTFVLVVKRVLVERELSEPVRRFAYADQTGLGVFYLNAVGADVAGWELHVDVDVLVDDGVE
jgi:hypothetical protein